MTMPVPRDRRGGSRAVVVDAELWPDVARVPACSAARARIGALVVRRALARLPLTVRWGGRETLGLGGPVLRVRDPGAFVRRIATTGLIGFGESYLAGEWEAEDLPGVLTVFARDVATLVPAPLQRLRGWWAPRPPAAERNTPRGARENIRRHYDLSNELFAEFLDETMTYSAALFPPEPDRPLTARGFGELAAAQRRKIDALLDAAGVGAGSRVLEIGTGWGELALRAAGRGASVVSVTLSREQAALARERVAAAGFADRVEVRIEDYREVSGSYDAVVSVEMVEAVGAEYWEEYLRVLDRRLAPGGRVAVQAITMPHERMLPTRRNHTWIHKYVFPGGMIPSVRALTEAAREHTGLRPVQCTAFGPHYARTLALWRERFGQRAERVAALGFDATFRRMWTFYLAYSEAGFASGYLDVHHLVFARPAEFAAGAGGGS
ncbi:class I SAM-dependent methyltransferase [Streptomyces sp. BI20]|uniref:class I SAM-dependent methyltransferase n=1 Tax=Streptomyces sp. BI20 TaxID=3403460 RepID=UPI003C774A77